MSDLAEQEDFTKYIPQQNFIDDSGRVRRIVTKPVQREVYTGLS